MIDIYKEIKVAIAAQDDRMAAISHISTFIRDFLLCPSFFKAANDLPHLEWKSIPFEKKDHRLPSRQGVYAFAINVNHPFLPNNSYIMYVGKAGDSDSKNTIAKRYKDYISEIGHMTRPTIHTLLNLWRGHLTYYYAEVPKGMSTGTIEKTLTTIFVPPYCTNDYFAEVRSLLRGASIL
jgi:hypothetical protein